MPSHPMHCPRCGGPPASVEIVVAPDGSIRVLCKEHREVVSRKAG